MALRQNSAGGSAPPRSPCRRCLPRRPLAVTDADRIAVYKEFRAQFDAKKYAEAQPLAERLVELTEEQYGAEELPLTNPLTNLATVHYKLGNYPAAIENYQRTLRILQAKSTHRRQAADPSAARPRHQLHGRERSGVRRGGAEARRRPVAQYRWPVQHQPGRIHRRADRRLRSHAAAAPRRKRKPLRDARRGSRVRPQLDQAARPPRQAGALVRSRPRATPANATSTNGRSPFSQKTRPDNDLRRVGPLRGIARSFRLEAFYGVEGADTGATFNSGQRGAPVFTDGTQQRRGESSLTAALAIIDANTPVESAAARRGAHRSRRLVPGRECAAPRLRHLCRRLEGARAGRATPGCSRRRASSPTGRRSARSTARSSIRRKP